MTVPYPDRRVHADCTRGTFYAHYEQKEDCWSGSTAISSFLPPIWASSSSRF